MKWATRETFHGYGPEQGYELLRQAIAENDFRARGLDVADDEIFVSDGSKCDSGNILDILGAQNVIAITDPVYPVYVDTNVMAGHTGDADDERRVRGPRLSRSAPRRTASSPTPPKRARGRRSTSASRTTRPAPSPRARSSRRGSTYARANDSASSSSTPPTRPTSASPAIPHSIYEIPGARECAIEFRSFSKNGGFTGVRCAFTVVPKTLLRHDRQRRKQAAAPALDAPAHDEVQRRLLHRPARRRGALLAGGQGAGARAHRALHGQCAHPPRSRAGRRAARSTAA